MVVLLSMNVIDILNVILEYCPDIYSASSGCIIVTNVPLLPNTIKEPAPSIAPPRSDALLLKNATELLFPSKVIVQPDPCIAPPCLPTSLLLNITEMFLLNVMIEPPPKIAPPASVAPLSLNVTDMFSVNVMTELYPTMAPPLWLALFSSNVTDIFPMRKILEPPTKIVPMLCPNINTIQYNTIQTLNNVSSASVKVSLFYMLDFNLGRSSINDTTITREDLFVFLSTNAITT